MCRFWFKTDEKSPKTALFWGKKGLFSKSAFPSLIRQRRIRVVHR
jgi:hypothetical protein